MEADGISLSDTASTKDHERARNKEEWLLCIADFEAKVTRSQEQESARRQWILLTIQKADCERWRLTSGKCYVAYGVVFSPEAKMLRIRLLGGSELVREDNRMRLKLELKSEHHQCVTRIAIMISSLLLSGD